jgi:hypothetical protein
MNILEHISDSESLKTIFWLKYLISFMQIWIRDPESFCPWIQDPGWKNSDPGSEINIPDPQHNFPDPHHYIFGSLTKKTI